MTLFTLFGREVNYTGLALSIASLLVLIYIYRYLFRFLAPRLKNNLQISEQNVSRLKRILRWSALFVLLIVITASFSLDFSFNFNKDYELSVLLVLKGLFLWQLAQLLDWMINNLFLDYFYPKGSRKNNYGITGSAIRGASRTVQYIFYLIVIIYIIRNFGLEWRVWHTDVKGKSYDFFLSNLFEAALVILIGKLIAWALIHLALYRGYEKSNIDVGSQFAINQLVRYVVFTFAIIYALSVVGINMTLLLGGAAALLVGVGLGLQQTFNDFISGIVLLFERTVAVGDVLEFDGTVGVVKKIGLRSSIVHTRLNVSMVVPNHQLVNDRITNWTHNEDSIRFAIEVGVAYGSDTKKVKELLIQSLENVNHVLDFPKPFVRFTSFGNSSLDFCLYFFSKEYMAIEDVKSNIRMNIDQLFRENGITIPFPQREVRILNQP